MRKIAKKTNSKIFDLASGPLYLTMIGIPILIVIVVIILIIVTVKLIKKARQKNFQAEKKTEKDDPPGKAE